MDRFVYAASFSDGRIKIGTTTKPRERLRQIAKAYAGRAGARIVASHVAPVTGMGHHSERAILDRLSRIACRFGGEVFVGISYAHVLHLLKQIARRSPCFMCSFAPFNKKLRAAWDAETARAGRLNRSARRHLAA